MKCPVDDATLLLSERSGVEIDYCPQCRGVWLDRGELDKLLERADDDGDDDDRRSGGDRSPRGERDFGIEPARNGRPPKKKRRWLSEMFEID